MSHRVTEQWMGEQVETLEDLLRPGLHAVCIGINPAPASVSAGHYYQGKLGQMFYERLRRAGLLPRGARVTFKKTAEVLFGPLTGNGHIRDLDFGGSPVFVMPGPYAPGSDVQRRLAQLRELADRQHSD